MVFEVRAKAKIAAQMRADFILGSGIVFCGTTAWVSLKKTAVSFIVYMHMTEASKLQTQDPCRRSHVQTTHTSPRRHEGLKPYSCVSIIKLPSKEGRIFYPHGSLLVQAGGVFTWYVCAVLSKQRG